MAPRRTCECDDCPKCAHREYMKQWYAGHAEQHRETARESRGRRIGKVRAYDRARGRSRPGLTKEKEAARMAVFRALERGELEKQPCIDCGDADVQGHHEDYTKPLEVLWLCRRHHMERHHTVGVA